MGACQCERIVAMLYETTILELDLILRDLQPIIDLVYLDDELVVEVEARRVDVIHQVLNDVNPNSILWDMKVW